MKAAYDEAADRREWNESLGAHFSNTTRGYIVVTAGAGDKTHAAATKVLGHSGYWHPRSMCQISTPREYHMPHRDQATEVTCKRCLAAMAKRGLV